MRYKKTTHRYYDAWQFQPGQLAPDWVNKLINDGNVGFTDITAQKLRVHASEYIIAPGDWLIKEQSDRFGSVLIRTDELFRLEFTPDVPQTPGQPQDFKEGIAAGLADFEQKQASGV